ncbi:MAG: hypothetical protein V4673_14345 [Pseudomonadota bacterium]
MSRPELTYRRRKLSNRQREELYDRCRGDKDVPDCNLCGCPILLHQPWHESHEGAPHALGGTETGVAHAECNRRDGAEVVTPMVAKAKRNRQKFIGAFRTKYPMRGGRNDRIKICIGGGVKPRKSLSQKHADLMAKRQVQP